MKSVEAVKNCQVFREPFREKDPRTKDRVDVVNFIGSAHRLWGRRVQKGVKLIFAVYFFFFLTQPFEVYAFVEGHRESTDKRDREDELLQISSLFHPPPPSLPHWKSGPGPSRQHCDGHKATLCFPPRVLVKAEKKTTTTRRQREKGSYKGKELLDGAWVLSLFFLPSFL